MRYARKLLREHNKLNDWKNPQILDKFNDKQETRYLHPI